MTADETEMLRRLAADGEQVEPDDREGRSRFCRAMGGLQRWGLVLAQMDRKSRRWRIEITWRGLEALGRLPQPAKRRRSDRT